MKFLSFFLWLLAGGRLKAGGFSPPSWNWEAMAFPLGRGDAGVPASPGCPTQALVPLSPHQRASCFADIWFWLRGCLFTLAAPPPSIKPVSSIEFPLWEILSGFIILLTLWLLPISLGMYIPTKYTLVYLSQPGKDSSSMPHVLLSQTGFLES